MSMIGKLRQVSEFELAKYKKNPAEMVRALSGGLQVGEAQAYTQMRELMDQSPAVLRMMELRKQGKMPTREELLEVQREATQALRQMGAIRKAALSKAAPPAQPQQPGGPVELDLHKSWHCLHFLFTGKAEGSDGSPLGDAILGGAEIGGDAADTGYGPPRALSPTQVKSVAAALDAFPIGQKVEQFDPGAADRAGVYVPQHGSDELKEYFAQLRRFYDDAASKGNAVLLWIE